MCAEQTSALWQLNIITTKLLIKLLKAMRIDPAEKIVNNEAFKAKAKLKTEKITRIIALVVAFISVFFFIIKILFL